MCRDLQSNGDPFLLELPQCRNRAPLWNHQEIQTLPDCVYGWRRNESLAALDAVCQPDLLYQVIVSEQHGITTHGLVSAANKLCSGLGGAKLIFAVPPDAFTHDFSKQTLKAIKGRSDLTELPRSVQAVCHPNTHSALDSGHIHRTCITTNTANGLMMAFKRHDWNI